MFFDDIGPDLLVVHRIDIIDEIMTPYDTWKFQIATQSTVERK